MIASYQIKYQQELNNQSEYEPGDGEQSDQMKEFYYSSSSDPDRPGLWKFDPIYCSFDNSCKVYQSQLGFKLTTFLSKTS